MRLPSRHKSVGDDTALRSLWSTRRSSVVAASEFAGRHASPEKYPFLTKTPVPPEICRKNKILGSDVLFLSSPPLLPRSRVFRRFLLLDDNLPTAKRPCLS
jgi:hypothetical protein